MKTKIMYESAEKDKTFNLNLKKNKEKLEIKCEINEKLKVFENPIKDYHALWGKVAEFEEENNFRFTQETSKKSKYQRVKM